MDSSASLHFLAGNEERKIEIRKIKREEEEKSSIDIDNSNLDDGEEETVLHENAEVERAESRKDSIKEFPVGRKICGVFGCSRFDEKPEMPIYSPGGDFTLDGCRTGKKNKKKIYKSGIPREKDASSELKSKYRPCSECSKIVLKKNYSLHLRVHSLAMPHMCDICGRCFKWRRVMEGHKRTHTGEKPYLCNTCGKSFTSSSRLSDHSTVHTGKKSYVCELCATAFRDKKHLLRHFRTHTGEKPFKCGFCGRGFANSWNLKEHTRRHTGELPHICPVCNQGFNRNKNLEEHVKARHEKCSAPEQKEELDDSSACYEYLQVEVSSPPNPTESSQKELEIKTEDCSFKQEVFPYADTEDHWTEDETEPLATIKDGHGRSKLKKDCNIKVECCDSDEVEGEVSRLLKIPNLKNESEESGSKIKIPKPPKVDKTPSVVKAPKRGRVLKPQFIDCEVCGKSVQRRKFKLHMMVHNGEKPHLCDTCGKSFTWKFALVTHKRVHSGEKPYLCKHCGQSFRSSSRFAEHSTIHTGRRSYVCERCALAFRTSGRLKRHLRIHTGEKPYICSYCERGFSESYNLKQHRRLHTGEKPPHVCYICTQAFIRKKMLMDHLRIHHGIDQPPLELLHGGQQQQRQEIQEPQQREKESRVSELKISEDHPLTHSSPVININISFDEHKGFSKNFLKDLT